MSETQTTKKQKSALTITVIAVGAVLGLCTGIAVGVYAGLRVGRGGQPTAPPPATSAPEATNLPAERAPAERAPTERPPDSGSPTLPPAEGPVSVQSFTVEPPRIEAGGCVTFSWAVDNADSIQLKRDETVLLENAPASGTYQECPPQKGVFRYRLEASNGSGHYNWSELLVIVD